jgi:hypothetical protein
MRFFNDTLMTTLLGVIRRVADRIVLRAQGNSLAARTTENEQERSQERSHYEELESEKSLFVKSGEFGCARW